MVMAVTVLSVLREHVLFLAICHGAREEVGALAQTDLGLFRLMVEEKLDLRQEYWINEKKR
jgi:hypothetical protein